MLVQYKVRLPNEDISKFIHMADDVYLPIILNKKYDTILNKLYLKENNLYSYNNSIVVLDNDSIVGMCWFYDSSMNRVLSIMTWLYILQISPRIALRMLIIRRDSLTVSLDKDSVYILVISTDQAHRNIGIGKALLCTVELEAAIMKKKKIELDVAENNIAAFNFYQHNMFKEKFRHVFRQGKMKTTYIRMEKEI